MPQESWDPFETPPDVVGDRYRVGELAGEGGAATVHRCIDSRDGSVCAIKFVRAPLLSAPMRFVAEIRGLSKLKHPRIVPVWDAGREGNWYWYTMPYYPDGSIADLVKRGGALRPTRALRLAFQLLQGLDAVHGMDMIHRDVKPHNVLLDADGDAKLADFGLAKHLRGDVPFKTGMNETMGSPSYRAPEVARDPSTAGVEADLYGAGATLYWMLVGRRPGMFHMMEEADLDERLGDLTPELREIIVRSTDWPPDRRYTSARQMAEVVAQAFDALPSRADARPQARAWMGAFDVSDSSGFWHRVKGWLGMASGSSNR